MGRTLPSGTVTFLYTDIEGSTRLLRRMGAAGYAAALKRHRQILRSACAANGGVETATEGDSFMAAFPTATGAVRAAQAIAEQLDGGPIRVRAGLHTGSPLVTDEGYVGEVVHIAARVASAAHGGQVVLTGATRALLDDSVRLSDAGEHRFKDLEHPIHVFELGSGRFPPLATVSNTNLPRPASSFVGRQREVATVRRRLESGARLVTVTGPGGAGKTRLAIETAAALVPMVRGGTFWVGLDAVRDPALVVQAISQALGAPSGLPAHIGDRDLLLVLDNFEHVIEAAPEVSRLLAACANLAVLVTSRELLRIDGEVEFRVPPLAVPDAVALFCERARLDADADVVELCARLDHLPLALELAAARARILTPAEILDRLASSLDFLRGGRDASTRQRTLRATVEWSYGLLPAAEQRLFEALSIFAGGFTLAAAEAVADADVDALQSLVDKSLVQRWDGRLGMLETIRELAVERLADDRARELRRRHAAWFARLADEPAADAQDPAAIATLRAELDNFRVALEWLDAEGPPEMALGLAMALTNLWVLAGYAAEGARAVLAALEASSERPPLVRAKALRCAGDLALDHGDYATATDLLTQAVALFREADADTGIALSLVDLGHVAKCEEDYARAEALFAESIRIARDRDDRSVLAAALLNLGDCLVAMGEFARAASACEQSLALHRELGADMEAAACRYSLGLARLHQARPQEAADQLGAALQTFLSFDYGVGIACALEGLAALAADEHRHRDAAVMLGAAESLFELAGASLEPAERALHERTTAAVGARLGGARLAQLRAEGKRMTLDDALAHAARS